VRAHCPESEWITLLEALAGRVILAIEKSELVNTLNQSNAEIQLAYDSTLEGWTRALDLRDRETEGHTRRVTEMTLALAEALGDSDLDFVNLRRGALLHDIGKMGIPDRILHKPGPLDEQEWATMKLHPVYAYEMLSPIDYLRPAVEIPYGHHERWDGGGYPRGLRGSEIPKAARVFAVADVWDALRSDRPYRKSWSEDRARGYIELNAEVQFDPRVVDAFLSKEVYKKPLTAGR
jgi:putative nucleotidyltransferase with HDIG domain